MGPPVVGMRVSKRFPPTRDRNSSIIFAGHAPLALEGVAFPARQCAKRGTMRVARCKSFRVWHTATKEAFDG